MIRTWAVAGCVAAVLAAGGAGAAPVVVDGLLGAGEYGTPTATVAYNPDAPTGNFGQSPALAPTNESNQIAYAIYLTTRPGFVYGLVQAQPEQSRAPGATPGMMTAPVAAFANVYFDLDPGNNNGSDLGFELGSTSKNAFVPGKPGGATVVDIAVAVSSDGLTLEFAIPVAAFTAPIAGLTYYGGQAFPADGEAVVLRLSQSFGYSVAGGPEYGPTRLGAVVLEVGTPADVPEPATLALLGMGLLGLGTARRRA